MRKPAVLESTGWSTATLYAKIAAGIFPAGTKLDPNGRAVVWFDDQVAEFQAHARNNQTEAA
jgi:predicted DNA-binding transcriptional regulator AlpA